MSYEYVDKVKGFMLNRKNTLLSYKNEGFKAAIKYLMISLFISYFLAMALELETTLDYGKQLTMIIMSYAIIKFIIIVIAGITLHFSVRIMGGKKGLSTTMRTVFYAATPNLLLGFIPYLWIITIFWSIGLEIIAITELQEISVSRAFMATFLSTLVIVALLIAIVFGVVIYCPDSYVYDIL